MTEKIWYVAQGGKAHVLRNGKYKCNQSVIPKIVGRIKVTSWFDDIGEDAEKCHNCCIGLIL